MPPESHIFAVAHVIQLAVAPVFLLSGVGTFLSVLLGRLNRIVDRARTVEGFLVAASEPQKNGHRKELHSLSRRARLTHWAITLTTICGLFVCIVIVTLFTGQYLRADLSPAILLCFIIAMIAIVTAFFFFLREIQLGTASLRFGPR